MSGEGGFVPVAVDAVIPRLYAVCEKLHSKGWKLREAVVWEIEASLYALLDVTVSDEDAAKIVSLPVVDERLSSDPHPVLFLHVDHT